MKKHTQDVWANPLIQQAMRTDREVAQLLKHATMIQSCYNRWPLYSRFKRCAKLLVGWNARQPGLRTSGYYQAVIQALDALLPETAEEAGALEPEEFYGEIERIEARIQGVQQPLTQDAILHLCAAHQLSCKIDDLSVSVKTDGGKWQHIGWTWDVKAMGREKLEALLITLAVPVTEREKEAAE